MPIIIRKEFFDENKNLISQKGMLNILRSKKVFGGEDYYSLDALPPARLQIFDMSKMIVTFSNFQEDKSGNITADIIKYGVLREFTDKQISFVLRAFLTDLGRINVVAIDVKYG